MIVQPKNWREIGQPILLDRIEKMLIEILSELRCKDISFSGGIDSCLLVKYTLSAGIIPTLHTIGSSMDHPDVVHASMAAKYFSGIMARSWATHLIHIHAPEPVGESTHGQHAVEVLYEVISEQFGVERIIAGDGIDEFMGGYYAHQTNPSPEIYYDYLRRLVPEHLENLDSKSGNVKVYLPYLDPRITSMLTQIPLEERFDSECRKKIMVELAMRADLPEDIILRRKYGFCSALEPVRDPSKVAV